jgi:hypothetical protein
LVLSPTGSINLGFTTEGRLAAVLIIPSLGVSNWSVIYINTAPSICQGMIRRLERKAPLLEGRIVLIHYALFYMLSLQIQIGYSKGYT